MKERFMKALSGYLSQLEKDEREEILRFYEERFYTGRVYEGKTEEEIVGELESPEDIARNVMKEYGYDFKRSVSQKAGHDVDVSKVVGVALFDVFIASWLLPALFSVLVAVFVSLFAFIGAMVFMPWSSAAAGIFMGIALIGLTFLWALIVLWLYDTLISFASWLLKWHLEVLGFGDKDWPKTIDKFKASYYFKRHPRYTKLKNRLKVLGALMIVVGFSYHLFTFGTISLSGADSEMVEYSDAFVVSESESWKLKGEMDVGNVEFHRHDSDEVMIEASIIENADMTIDIQDETNTVVLTNAIEFPFFNFTGLINLFRSESQTVDIYLPNDFNFDSVEIEHMNGGMTLRDMTLNTLDIDTMNGNLELINVTVVANSDIETTNGNINVRSSALDRADMETTNGRIDIRELMVTNLKLDTTNGRITLESINDSSASGTELEASTTNGEITLDNVYMNDVTLSTTNGSVHFDNADTAFILDNLDVSTTNGSEDINVLQD